MALIFDPSGSSKVKRDGANRKPVDPTTKCSQESTLISVTVFEIFRVKILTVDLMTLAGLTCPPRSTILQNFSPIARTMVEICVTKAFHFLAPGGLTPGPKFTKRGDDLADYEIYHPAKFHRSRPTHAQDIRYQNSCGQKNKYASCPDWRISPHADRRHHSCKRYFWQCLFKHKIQNTLYGFMSTILRQ